MPDSPGASSCSRWPRAGSPNSDASRPWPPISQTIVRFPRPAATRPRAVATVVLPTPPLPVTKTSRFPKGTAIGRKLEGLRPARANRHSVMGLFERKPVNGGEISQETPSPSPDSAPPPEEAAVTPKAKVIAFTNQKGGVAKTTTTVNLAVAFVESGYRVLCVDLDPQANLTMSQGIDPDTLQVSMYDVLVHGT